MPKGKYDYIEDELKEISLEFTRVQNRLFSLKLHVKMLKENKQIEGNFLEFDDPLLDGVSHG